ncbi:hypothetical protein A9P82_02480 [Arachidicoccus ginsenosidimutans]|uniref:hypothetical protein n=1 Tax=Arachidicoccus sp. BS20 TaxID=1850526 RepID=UPI0007F15B74|nr:hypothetical protein [Arachidicoccus sp. BS20]ANI88268.1 hypothetical protein A9P82_02480 [Arachidicoccus sp. BS20]
MNQHHRIEVNEFIALEINELNHAFRQGSILANKEFAPFTINDYKYVKESQDYFGVFAVPYFLTYSIYRDIENRINHSYLKEVWFWIKDAEDNRPKDFLPIQTKLLRDTLNSYMALLKSGNHLQALILFRSYIEYSSQLYASLLDYDFFLKYTGSGIVEEEYQRLWFSTLKPSKVLAKIKSMHTEINSLLKDKKIDYGMNALYRRIFNPFDSKLRGYLYSELSRLAHGSHSAVTTHDEVKLYALVWLCTSYLVESHVVIDEIVSVYFKYSPTELFSKWITVEVYLKSKEPKTLLFLAEN